MNLKTCLHIMWQMDIPIVVVIWIQDRHNMHYGLNT
jgi:hypothetical protein